MLELQRASAGSGKTYALAKKFIWYYITISEEGGKRRLRTAAELTDSLSHILAVTFTNKATNEMQQRIVEKLYYLGYPPKSGKRPDYMSDFLKELNTDDEKVVTEKMISETCRRGVALLLNNYSDFHVSTIDSFFQQVLRTFAYESDLSDSYRIELDTDFLSAMAIDSILEDINSGRQETAVEFWIEELMSRAKGKGKKWNVFLRNDSYNEPYNFLIEAVKRLENEEFKQIRGALDNYFSSTPDFPEIYKDMRERYEKPVTEAHRRLTEQGRKMRGQLKTLSFQFDPTDYNNYIKKLDIVSKSEAGTLPKDYKGSQIESIEIKQTDAYNKRKKKGDTEAYNIGEELFNEVCVAYSKWVSELQSPQYRHWRLYRENIPFMGLLQTIREKRERYLRENNAIELGETNAMLHEIIGEDEAPFIYERIGTRLNHFLIDEFQDTSKMQWRNLSPLLHESSGRGNENLIIGDAKQSIYRFRNADSSLITRRVPMEFGISGTAAATGSVQNTNWRSDLRIVQFNNSFFEFLSRELNRTVGREASEERRDFESDYQNVVQHPHHKEEQGYVEVRFKSEDDLKWEDYVMQSLLEIVNDLLLRGFKMKDIAVLVDTNSQGEKVIETFTEYNAQLPEGIRRIEYISEQSLKLSTSAAVSFVVSVLETVSRGADPEVRTGEDRDKRGVAEWSQLACNFKFFALRHPELSTPDCLELFLQKGGDNDAIGKMLQKMQAVTLPALVESIIAEFLPEQIRKTDAVFLAAFQDIVLEYCESRPSDVASFLRWWNDKKGSASIASPDDMDAVSVMTVHKSKGLEYPVVIVPFANTSFKDAVDKPEWRWVVPELVTPAEGELPPFMPVATDSLVEGTKHEDILFEYYDLKKMDELNTIYVAFTRAANELYIFARPESKSGSPLSMSGLLRTFFERNADKADVQPLEYADSSLMEQRGEEMTGYSYGEKYARYQHEENVDKAREVEMRDYISRPTPDFLQYTVADLPEVVDAEDPELSDDPDPRSEGNILHEIMQQVRTREDIPRAARRMAIKGVISKTESSRMAAELTVKTSVAEVRDWFDGGWKVINERPLLRAERRLKRPDRVMISDRGDAVVIDYKFGESLKTGKRYAKQVRDYVESLKNTGKFRSVKGYLWYVRLDKVEFVAE